jgi:hypothetical protein
VTGVLSSGQVAYGLAVAYCTYSYFITCPKIVNGFRLELHADNNKPELVFMEQVEEINTELQQVLNVFVLKYSI